MQASVARHPRTRPHRSNSYVRCLLALLFLLFLGACSDAFDPLTEAETDFFAVFGFLDTSADTQFVRVSPLRAVLNEQSTGDGISVVSTVLSSGEQVVWHDSLVQLTNGQTGLLYYAEKMTLQDDEIYRLDVRGPGEQVTRAFTRTPAFFPLQVSPPVRSATSFTQIVTWEGLQTRPAQARLSYRIQRPNAAAPDTLIVPYQDPGRPAEEGWSFSISLSQDRLALLEMLERSPDDNSVVLLDIHLEIEQRSEEWQRINQPPLNITQGFGFFGAVARHGQTWTLEPSVATQVGFALPPSSMQQHP